MADEAELTRIADRPRPGRRRPGPGRLLRAGETYGLVVITAAVVVVFGLLPETHATFLTQANLSVVVGNQAVLAIIALGAMIPLIAGEFDLSVGSNAGLCSVVSATYLAGHGASITVGVLMSIALGAGVGLVNGILAVHLRVTSFVATLGTATLISGAVSQYTSGASVINVPAGLTSFGDGDTAEIPNTLWVLIVVALATVYLLDLTPFGRYLSAIGANRQAAVLVGLPVRAVSVLTYVTAGVFAGGAGALLVARLGGANPATGFDYTLPALGAVFLGATAIRPGRFNTAGTFVAIFFLAAVSSGLSLYGAPGYVQDYINGGALVVGVAFSAQFAARRRRGAV